MKPDQRGEHPGSRTAADVAPATSVHHDSAGYLMSPVNTYYSLISKKKQKKAHYQYFKSFYRFHTEQSTDCWSFLTVPSIRDSCLCGAAKSQLDKDTVQLT